MSLLTGRQLVNELARLGLGTWSPEAVRQWIRETPACPIGEAADQGKPHRYRLLDVLRWLQERAQREKSKGYTTGGTLQLIERLEIVMRQFVTGAMPAENSAPIAAGAGAGGVAAAADLFQPAASKPTDFDVVDIEQSTDLELVLQVIKGRSPQVWKQIEEALNQRRKRLEGDGKLVPVEDLERTAAMQAVATRTALIALALPLAQQLPDTSTAPERRAILQQAFERLLTQLAHNAGEDQEQAA